MVEPKARVSPASGRYRARGVAPSRSRSRWASRLEAPRTLCAVARAGGDEVAVLGHAHLVLDGRHEPGLGGVLGMDRDAEAEARAGELPFVGEVVGAEEHAVMVLAPEMVRLAAALHDAVRVLDCRVLAPAPAACIRRTGPLERQVQLAPASSLRHTPPQDMAMTRRLELRGSTQIRGRRGARWPPPNHFARSRQVPVEALHQLPLALAILVVAEQRGRAASRPRSNRAGLRRRLPAPRSGCRLGRFLVLGLRESGAW